MFVFRLLMTAVLVMILSPCTVNAMEKNPRAEIHVAVASNFATCFESLAEDFTRETGIPVLASPGSTGRHYAQIKAGAPFHIFLAADARRPKLLEDCGTALDGSRFTYAVGRLVFWCPSYCHQESGPLTSEAISSLLTRQEIKHFAVANPRLAPYGKAAQQVLENLGIEADMQPSLVTGQNISQAWQFVASGNAEAGLVALSQVVDTDSGQWYLIPSTMHEPIIQQGVLLAGKERENQREAAQRLIQYLQSPAAQKIMATFGYENDEELKP